MWCQCTFCTEDDVAPPTPILVFILEAIQRAERAKGGPSVSDLHVPQARDDPDRFTRQRYR